MKLRLQDLTKQELLSMRNACRRVMNRVGPARMRQWAALLNELDHLVKEKSNE